MTTPRSTFLVLLVLLAAAVGGAAGAAVASLPVPVATGAPTASPLATATIGPNTGIAFPDVPAIIAGVTPSVVAIDVVATVRIGPRTVTQKGAGTGFVIASDGVIATCAHVVAGAQEISVRFADGSTKTATVVGADESADLAVIHVDRVDLVPLPTGRSALLRVGDLAIALGNALALEGGPTASLGIISALDRTITTSDGTVYAHLVQTDAAINPGDSGGPLLDIQGRVIGINTAGATTAENVGFAIAIDAAQKVFDSLRAAASQP